MPTPRLPRRRALALGLGLSLITVLGCNSIDSLQSHETPQTQGAEPLSAKSAPYDYAKDEPDTLLTYLGPQGRFLIAETLSEIPESARTLVRVVKDTKVVGSSEFVFVGDLKGPGPNFLLKEMKRSVWEMRGKAARTAELKAITATPKPQQGALAVDVTLYGASWCGACKAAEAHLQKRGVRLIKKDIEEEAGARSEMKRKMKSAGLSGSSIPVLDIGGIILLGASPKAIDVALKRAQSL